jgi:hypothetical protein
MAACGSWWRRGRGDGLRKATRGHSDGPRRRRTANAIHPALIDVEAPVEAGAPTGAEARQGASGYADDPNRPGGWRRQNAAVVGSAMRVRGWGFGQKAKEELRL